MPDPSGSGGFFIADSNNCLLRFVSSTSVLSTFAGQAPGPTPGVARCGALNIPGIASAATIGSVRGLAYTPSGTGILLAGARVCKMLHI